jgi:hypothetical protein
MRATIYGLKSGAVDLLITEEDTYVLMGAHHSPTQCTSLARDCMSRQRSGSRAMPFASVNRHLSINRFNGGTRADSILPGIG